MEVIPTQLLRKRRHDNPLRYAQDRKILALPFGGAKQSPPISQVATDQPTQSKKPNQ